MEKIYKLPFEDVNDEEAIIIDIPHKSGARVNKGDAIYSYETTKALIEVTAEDKGYIFYLVNVNDVVPVGNGVCFLSTDPDFNIDSLKEIKAEKEKKEDYQLTKKAQDYIVENQLDISAYPLKGIVRVKDLLEFSNPDNDRDSKKQRILKLDKDNSFINSLLNDGSIKNLSSEDKIKLYRDNGHKIGDNVFIEEGAIIIGNNIIIEDNVTIGKDTYIEVPSIEVLKNTSIGKNCEIVASRIVIGDFNKIASEVSIDISGGRYFDSNLFTGRGCLIASGCYINVCRQVKLGDYVALSPKSMIFTHSYWQSILDGYPINYGTVELDNDSWLGANAQILPNTKIGKGSIIISGSLIVSDVQPFTMVGGIPATILKRNLKKEKTPNQINQILDNLFNELIDSLESNGFMVERQKGNKFIVAFEDKKISCGLSKNNESDNELKDCNLIIGYSIKKDQFIESSLIFSIQDKTINGEYNELGKFIREFFRHKGIQLYHT